MSAFFVVVFACLILDKTRSQNISYSTDILRPTRTIGAFYQIEALHPSEVSQTNPAASSDFALLTPEGSQIIKTFCKSLEVSFSTDVLFSRDGTSALGKACTSPIRSLSSTREDELQKIAVLHTTTVGMQTVKPASTVFAVAFNIDETAALHPSISFIISHKTTEYLGGNTEEYLQTQPLHLLYTMNTDQLAFTGSSDSKAGVLDQHFTTTHTSKSPVTPVATRTEISTTTVSATVTGVSLILNTLQIYERGTAPLLSETTTTNSVKNATTSPTTLPTAQSTPSSKFVNLTADFTATCLKTKDKTFEFQVERVDVFMEQTSVEIPGAKPAAGEDTCRIQITAASAKVFQIQIRRMDVDCNIFKVTLLELNAIDGIFKSCGDSGLPIVGTVYSVSNGIRLNAKAFRGPQNYSAQISFLAIPEEERPQLEVNFASSHKGYIQTPLWDGRVPHPSSIKSEVRIDIPQNHAIMISFPDLHLYGGMPYSCFGSKLSLFSGGTTSFHLIGEICGTVPPPPQLYHTHVMYARFVTAFLHSHAKFTGFRLQFTFHNSSDTPQKLPNGKWNCSVSYFPEFKSHFPCNLTSDCLNGEDEADCQYTTETCGQGRITLGGTCYAYVTSERIITWDAASVECAQRGGRLASLNTPQEWHGVGELLQQLGYVYLGLKSASPALPHMYRYAWQWLDNTIAYYVDISGFTSPDTPTCAVLRPYGLLATLCDQSYASSFLCEFDPQSGLSLSSAGMIKLSSTASHSVLDHAPQVKLVKCPAGHTTHEFLACDVYSSCWVYDTSGSCHVPLTPLPPSLTCSNGAQRVPYTLVCDHVADCSDHSDEDFCVHPQCNAQGSFQCGNDQCVHAGVQCDGIKHCVNGMDEVLCPPSPTRSIKLATPPPPAVVHFDGSGNIGISAGSNTTLSGCPETHFQCPPDGYCLPVFVRCNGVYDCPGREDEAGCDRYKCPGFYRCRSSLVCVHPVHMCDGVTQCPQGDDEAFCRSECPTRCTCYGLAFYCSVRIVAGDFLNLRFLDAGGSGMTAADVANNTMLVRLSLADCQLSHLSNMTLPNLRMLDLADNYLKTLSEGDLRRFPNLQVLSLAGNPLVTLMLQDAQSQASFPTLHTLVLSRVLIQEMDVSVLGVFPGLQNLNLSSCGTERVAGDGFNILPDLHMLDIRACPMTDFPRDILKNLRHLDAMFADNYKLCCPAILPDKFNLLNCHAPVDEISSCDALLRSDLYRVLLAVFAALTLLGNLGSFVFRMLAKVGSRGLGFGVFVTHLCVSDFLMSVYLTVIGVADRLYLGTYLWNDSAWKNSAVCRVAGFFCLLSTEVSAFIICLITLDRFLVLRFPFSALHFRQTSAHVACVIAWTTGFILSVIPLLPVTSHWRFYGQNGICIPLPITRTSFPGYAYSFGVMIVLNFVLFVLIALGQFFIYSSIRSNSMSASDTTRRSKDLIIARRLITVVMSDFLCWFPVCLLGLLASSGVPVPGEVNVAMAIFVLPLNSALNPFLYTVNKILERRQRVKEEKLRKRIESQILAKSTVTSVAERSTAAITRERQT